MSEQGQLSRQVSLTMALTVVQVMVAFANSVVVARICGPGGVGLYRLVVVSVAILAPLVSFGQSDATVFLVARKRRPREVAGLAMLWSLGLLAVAMAVAWAVIAWGGLDGPSRATVGVVVAVAFALPGAIYVQSVRSDWLGRDRVWAYNLAPVASSSLLLAVNSTLLLRSSSLVLWTLPLAHLGCGLLLVAARGLEDQGPRWPTGRTWSAAFAYGKRAAVFRTLELALGRVDALVLAALVPLELVGLYAVADQMLVVLALVAGSAGRVLFLHSARDSDGTGAREKTERLLGVTARAAVPVVLVSGLAGTILVPWVYGGGFRPAVLALWLLLPALVARTMSGVLSTYFLGRERHGEVLTAVTIALSVDLVLLAVGVPTFGWLAAAVAKSVAELVGLACLLRAFGPFAWAGGASRRRNLNAGGAGSTICDRGAGVGTLELDPVGAREQ